ncbi:MAG: hypothetical protein Kow0090_14390 [Myxococcota bacterium]
MSAHVRTKSIADLIVEYFQSFKVLKETGKEYWGVQIVNFLDCTIYFALISIASIFLSDDIGMNDKDAGYVITVFTSATTIFLFFSGMFTDWLGIRKSLYIAMGGSLILRAGVALIGLVDTIPHRGIIVTVLFFLMAPIMAMIQTVFQAANKRFTTKRSRSAGFSLWYLFMNVGAAAGGFLIDIVRQGFEVSNAHIFTVGAVAAFICGFVVLILIRTEEPYELAEEGKEKETKKVERKNPFQIAREVVSEATFWRFVVLVALLLGVRAVFTYMYLLMPKYWVRTIGEGAYIGVLQAINPILIVIGIILFIPFANRYNIFKMLVYGSMVSAVSLFVMVIPWRMISGDIATAHYVMSISMLIILSVGEVIWSPKLSEYTAAIAPDGQEGTYLGLSMVPWFLTKVIISALSGHMLTRWSPEGIGEKLQADAVAFWDSPAAMWLILAIFALAGPIIALLLRGWLTKGARWKTEETLAEATA